MKKLFLLDGMALVYRAHFALIARPIFSSKGINTSALYGFTQTLLDILAKQKPTHVGVAFDTDAPTKRHADFADYKATRQAMPEDLSKALPAVRQMLTAFRIPIITRDGYEADDLIGTLVCRAAKEGFTSYMVTPDKDFGQLVSENVFIYKPGRMGSDVEVLGPAEVCARWGIQKPEQVVDLLALMGDSSDNIPGVSGIGEKTASKLIKEYGSLERLLSNVEKVPGKLGENLRAHTEVAVLSKKLATLDINAPCDIALESLAVQPRDDQQVKALFREFEFTSIARRLYGEDFRGGVSAAGKGAASRGHPQPRIAETAEFDFSVSITAPPQRPAGGGTASETKCQVTTSAEQRGALLREIKGRKAISVFVATGPGTTKEARPIGVAFATVPGQASYVPLPSDRKEMAQVLGEFAPVFLGTDVLKIGHDLKFALSVLIWNGFGVDGPIFDTMVAHSLVEPDARHTLAYLSEFVLGRVPADLGKLVGAQPEQKIDPEMAPVEKVALWAGERADLALHLWKPMESQLKEKAQERVFYDIECPLINVLVEMEHEGIKVDAAALGDFATQLAKQIAELEKTISLLAGTTFNVSSPKQLGTILFDVLKICDAPKKTRTGQYATDEQTLLALAPENEIVQRLLEHRAASKLKSTYADALPAAIWPATGRVHTTYNQVATATGRLNSQDPNLQNIPIRSERGQEIRKAFVPGGPGFVLLSADYSQIELRIIAALSREAGLLEAFRNSVDVHTATAAKVFNVSLEAVTADMRRKAKMVNYGIAYGISSFGLAQRLYIPRREAADIIDQYFRQFAGIREFMDQTIESARSKGYVETVTGRRRYIRDINSRNNSIRGSAERNAINAPIQGTAADMIKIAMIQIQKELRKRQLQTRMLLQVHDELVFDLFEAEEPEVRELVRDKMTTAILLEVPIVVDMGTGRNWLEAH